jgi:hypothetical protein
MMWRSVDNPQVVNAPAAHAEALEDWDGELPDEESSPRCTPISWPTGAARRDRPSARWRCG